MGPDLISQTVFTLMIDEYKNLQESCKAVLQANVPRFLQEYCKFFYSFARFLQAFLFILQAFQLILQDYLQDQLKSLQDE